MTTFVTAFLDLYEDRSQDKSVDTCFNHFSTLCSADISLVVFLSKCYMDKLHAKKAKKTKANIHYIPIELADLETYKEAVDNPLALPESRTPHHDTLHFMILMNAKIEFVKKAIDINPFKTTHFAWIDFSICHVFKHIPNSLQFLHLISISSLSKCLTFPGCWEKGQGALYLDHAINWRYCGGFFLGDAQSLQDFYTLYRTLFPTFLSATKTMLWEVNIWHKMELEGWSPQWYVANHDDSIIRIPRDLFYTVASLTTIPSRISTNCRRAIDSLLTQVDHVYLSVAHFYKRFQTSVDLPSYFFVEPYVSRVTIVFCDDKGPATKYLGAIDIIPSNAWIFFCDDDQEYAPTLLKQMRSHIDGPHIYQNRYNIIQKTTSGGLIHGYVGNLGHASNFKKLSAFPLPECAYHVDDQWLSIYCFLHNVLVKPSGLEEYSDIFQRLEDDHECIGADSLFSLGTRDVRVKQLEEYFNVRFMSDGMLVERK